MKRFLFALAALTLSAAAYAQSLRLNNDQFFEARGVAVHLYDGADAMSIVQRERVLSLAGGLIAADGVEPFRVEERNSNLAADKVEVKLNNGTCSIYVKGETKGLGLCVSVFLSEPLPSAMAGRINFGLALSPDLYLGTNCISDGRPRVISYQKFDANSLVLLPESDDFRLAVSSDSGITVSGVDAAVTLSSAIPTGKTGPVLEWFVEPSFSTSWTRASVPQVSRIGYLCGQTKKAVAEVGRNDRILPFNIYRINSDGHRQMIYQATPRKRVSREDDRCYLVADFSFLKEAGLYCLEYGDVCSDSFLVGVDICAGEWRNALKALNASRPVADDVAAATLSLVRLWENFRPEDDLDGDGVADVLALLRNCTELLLAEGAAADVPALAAASRVLIDFYPDLAERAISQAKVNMDAAVANGGSAPVSDYVNMWLATGEGRYRTTASKTESFEEKLLLNKLMDAKFQRKVNAGVEEYARQLASSAEASVFGVPEGRTTQLKWALDVYDLWRQYPESISPDFVLNALSAIYGSHTFADAQLLSVMGAKALPDFIRLSLACEEIARVLGR